MRQPKRASGPSTGNRPPVLMMAGEKGKKMLDKNGVEIKTGCIVRITGAFFKNDNGLYFVVHSPGDINWCGSDHCLKKISKAGKISVAKYSTCFWPIGIFVNDRTKAAEAHDWNKEHAEIEVVSIENMAEVAAYFRGKATGMDETIRRNSWNFGEDSEVVKKDREIQAHYEAVAASLE